MFIQCKFLLLDIPITEISFLDEVESIDDAAERLDHSLERDPSRFVIPPEVEFWGHYSNLQVWYEHGYDTRFLHSNLAFSLLGKLAEVGDPLAKKVFKSELITRYESGNDKTREFIEDSGALKYFSLKERLNLFLNTEDLIALTELAEEVWTDSDSNTIIQALIVEGEIELENRKVVKLDLSGLDLELEEFPKAILNLRNLRILYIGSSYIKQIPEEINRLCSLKELSVGSNEISQIPDSFCEVTSLEELCLGGNKIHGLPDRIGNLKNLKILRLGGNKIHILPESFCRLTSLENLNLSSNNLRNFPDFICKFKFLRHLDLSSNNLEDLPRCIEDLHSLEFLNISRNPLIEDSHIMNWLNNLQIEQIILS